MSTLNDVVGGLVLRTIDIAARAASIELAEREFAALSDERLRIALLGEFNSGKSTLLNALSGRTVAATDALEMTSWVATIRRGPVDEATVIFAEGGAGRGTQEGDQAPR